MFSRRKIYSVAVMLMIISILSVIGSSLAQQTGQGKFTATPLRPQNSVAASPADKATAAERRAPQPRPAVKSTSTKSSSIKSAPLVCTTPSIVVAPGASPAGGYLPLSLFGIPPVAGVGDDTITNFNTPTFLYTGQVWNSIGFASNGYAVIGGGSAPDITINNQNFPNPARPNNVLAPFWTDLNPAAGGAMRIGTLTDGSDTWIVLDWEAVKEFSTVKTDSFQIWIGINSDANPVEDISYAYGPIQGNGDGGFLTVGAENRFGTVGSTYYYNGTGTLPANGTQLRVTSTGFDTTPPTITAPPNVTVNTNTPQRTAKNVDLGTPITGDNCGVASVTNDAPAEFPLGVTIVTWTVTDTNGNTATAQQIVTVVDNQASEIMVGLTYNDQIITFNSNSPSIILSTKTITGLANGEHVLGIDYRPATGQLYGNTGYNRIVTINVATGVATPVAPITASLIGNEYGIDFNPTVDRLRLVNDFDQNASVDPNTGATTLQTPLNPGNPSIVGIAYSNNVAGASVTTLYDIDASTDTLYIQNPPASGTLTPVGALGVDTSFFVGFDISGNSGVAYASLTPGAGSRLYTINLATGAATIIGDIGSTPISVRYVTVSPVQSPVVFAITSQNVLLSFNAARPGTILSSTPITGLANGEFVLGIDFRPANGLLYGYTGYNSLITINTTTGAITRVGTTSALTGNAYGMDFNPVPDRVRLVNDFDQDARVNPDTAVTIIDGTLAYAAGDPNFGQNPNIVGAAYTNNFAGATSTELYDIDSNLDILVEQTPPNNGTLHTVGPLGINTTNAVGFDITGNTGAVYASLTNPGNNASSLYTVNLTTGAATSIGQIGGVATQVIGLAVSTIPAPTIYGLTPSNKLVKFNALSPNFVSAPIPITGLANGEFVLAIDFRPATGQLYGYTGYNSVITINTTTGAITRVGTPVGMQGFSYGFDLNPAVDRIRIGNDNDQNVRANPNNGTLVSIDTPLAYAPGDPNFVQNPNVVGAAYANNFAGATSTTLYDIDSNLDILVTQGSLNGSPTSANSGQLFTVGSLGFDTSGNVGFDIAPGNNAAYASLQPGGGGLSQLFTINLATGQATSLGSIGGTEVILGLAIAPAGTIQFGSPGATVTEGTDFSVTIAVTRTGDTSTTATIDYTTANGSASAGSDYLSTSGTLTFNPGETTKNIVVSLLNDAPPEPTETFSVTLSNPTGGASLGSPSTFTVTILDND